MPFWVYIMSNKHWDVFYTGVTNDIKARTAEHKQGRGGYFTSKYNCHCLVYYEQHEYIVDAIEREKKLKRWKRKWKLELIRKQNPGMRDLSQGGIERMMFDEIPGQHILGHSCF